MMVSDLSYMIDVEGKNKQKRRKKKKKEGGGMYSSMEYSYVYTEVILIHSLIFKADLMFEIYVWWNWNDKKGW